ncbi:peptidase S8/S53 domain-containing protein [Phlyctochytrium arcticum]|nr:peptidase S8/S53 domain-containing protein [Phlyctochytrium arcticum]
MLGVRSIFVLALTSLAAASPLVRRDTPIPGEYIVGFRYPTNNLAPRNVTALIDEIAGEASAHLASLGRRDGAGLEILNRFDLGDGFYQGFAFKSDSPAALASIQDHPDVEYIIPNAILPKIWRQASIKQAPTDAIPVTSGLWNLDVLDGDRDQTFNLDSSAGAGVDIYISDSGVDVNHPEFSGRIKWGYPARGKPSHYHGTHVAGIAAGKTYGVARKANIIAIETGDTVADIVASLEWMLKQVRGKGKTTVANMSWGFYDNYKSITDATRALVAADMAIAIAAGNERKESCLSVPSNTPGVINVAASNDDDSFATDYSDFGKCVHIIAPGTEILSAKLNGGTVRLTGTSMAAPHVAGALAVAISSGKAKSAKEAIAYVKSRGAKNFITKVPANNVNLFLQL